MLDKHANFLYRFTEIVQRYPENTAVLENGTDATSYRELYQNALKLAHHLTQHGDNDRVGIEIDKSAAYIAAVLGCWFAKKTFIPLDRKLPPERRAFIVQDANIGYILTPERFAQAGSVPSGDVLDIELPINQPAYVIYTSGTTGNPKGVLVSHNGIVNLADCQRVAFAVNAQSRYLFYLSTQFDASISDIVVCLLSGASLIIEKDAPLLIAASLSELIKNRSLTHLDIPPSLLKIMDIHAAADSLETIIIGGEACDLQTVRRWADKVNLINVYGPTEATVCTSLCRCTPQWDRPLLGEVIKNTAYKIFNDKQQLCDVGEAGELYIAGVGLALGYVNNGDLTRQKFVHIDDQRYYKTGDCVVQRADGEIQFLGRMDRQIKLRGQRIEPEEIETRLNAHPGVYKSWVGANQLGQLVAYVEWRELPHVNLGDTLREHLAASLPGWMIPAQFTAIERMPLTPNGKIDTLALRALHNPPSVASDNQGLTPVEQCIAEIFKKTTQAKYVGLNDNFYDLGGDSLGLIELILACEGQGLNIDVGRLMQCPTPKFIAENLSPLSSPCSVEDLLADTQADADFPIAKPSDAPIRNILITGATGFLGSALLKELLQQTSYHCFCLIRSDSEIAGFKRLKNTFQNYDLAFESQYSSRITVLCGDVGEAQLGLALNRYQSLCDGIDAVYHCAAQVNMVLSYEQLKNTNLNGVKRIAEFCGTGRQKTLHYASTLSVFVSTDQNTGILLESDRLEQVRSIYGGYGQSKFAAEKYLLGIPHTVCDVFIYRLGLITGSTQTGRLAKHDFLSQFIRGAKALGCLPDDPTRTLAVDITPVNYAATVLRQIASGETRERIFHIANPQSLTYHQFAQVMKKQGVISDIVPYEAWKAFIDSKAGLSSEERACVLALCRLDAREFERKRVFDLFQATSVQFDNRNVCVIVDNPCPPADEALVALYIQQAVQA